MALKDVGDVAGIPTVIPAASAMPEWAQGLMEQVAELKKENTMFKEMAGKNAIASFLDGKKDNTIKKVHFKKINDKVVIGWEKLDDRQFVFDAKNPLKEGLKMTLIFKDSSVTEVIDYPRFSRCDEMVWADVLTFDPFGKTKVRFDDGSELTVESKFLNA